ncbi:MAG: PIN domain-containing protein [Candidatus Dormibacteria bacterium]
MRADGARQFVDTSVLAYAHDTDSPVKRLRAATLLDDVGRARTLSVSVQVLQELFVTLTRKLPTRLSPRDAGDIVADLCTFTVHEPTWRDVLAAIELSDGSQLSLWDAMLVRSASQLGCTTLWTEDLTHGQVIAGVEVRNPF